MLDHEGIRLPAAGRTAALRRLAGLGAIALGFAAMPLEARQQVEDPPVTVDLGGRIQVRFTSENADDTNAFRVPRARLSLSGSAYEDFSYAFQADFSGSGSRLLDANLRYHPNDYLTLWAGQGKATFGRQWLTSSANLQFVDRTIVHARFFPDRQQGIALTARDGDRRVELNVGLHNGEGIAGSGNPDRRFMTVGRVVFTPFGPLSLQESALDRPEDPRLSVGVAALMNELPVGTDGPVSLTRFNVEAALRYRGFSAVSEFFQERSDPELAEARTADGWYVQAGLLLPGTNHEIAARHARVGGAPEVEPERTETGLAWSYYLRGHDAKVQADLRNLHDDASDTDVREVRVQLQLAF